MYADVLSAFKKKILQEKLILKLNKNEINDLNSFLNFLKEYHASFIDERFNAPYTLAERIVIMDCVTC